MSETTAAEASHPPRAAGAWVPSSGRLMAGKRGLVFGVANERSLAWGISRALAAQGAELAFTYQGETLERRVRPLAESLGSTLTFDCDLTRAEDLEAVAQGIAQAWPEGLDFIVHAVAWADKNELRGKYFNTERNNFLRCMDISCHSFTRIAATFEPQLRSGSSLLTLTYYGSERVMPHYNVMGVAKAALEASVRYLAADLGPRDIRVNALSAGPVKTLAASGIGDFRYILKWNEYNAPLRRNVSQGQVANAGLYLLSPLASGVTGAVHHVDSGYHTVGMVAVDSAAKVKTLLEGLEREKQTGE